MGVESFYQVGLPFGGLELRISGIRSGLIAFGPLSRPLCRDCVQISDGGEEGRQKYCDQKFTFVQPENMKHHEACDILSLAGRSMSKQFQSE